MNYEKFDHWNKKVFLVDMKKEKNKIFSEIVTKWLDSFICKQKNICIIVNKKGYSAGQICEDCGYVPKCEKCDVSIAYHKNPWWDFYWICHICKKQYNHYTTCPNCGWFSINNYWFWTEKIQEIIYKKYWKKWIIIESQTANSKKKIQKRKEQIWKENIIIWTSILSTPFQNIKFDLLIFINADIWLNIPDFQSNYKNFLFLYETISNYDTNTIIVQSFKSENNCIRSACKLDLEWFKLVELEYRKSFQYPPFWYLWVILYKNEVEERVFNWINKLYQELLYLKESWEYWEIEIYPTPPLIYKIYWKYRYNIIVKWKQVNKFLETAFVTLKLNQRWFKIDPNPENLI